ncbi:MAG: signal peptidase I [Ruminococcus sp.]|nr:signal peptidase I [Ruminococcus sp.]
MKKAFIKVLNIVVDVLVVMVLIVSVLVLTMVLTSQNESGVPSVFGKATISVLTDSMKGDKADDFAKGDLIISDILDDNAKDSLKKGDIVTFKQDINEDGVEDYVTHRIYKVNKDGTFQTKGDANDIYDQAPTASPQFPNVAKGEVLAKYSGTKIVGLGGVIDYLKTPLGFFLCVLLPMIIFFIYQAVRVVLNLIAYNKEKALNQAKELIEASDLTEEQKKKLAEEYLAAQAANSGEDEKETPPEDTEVAVEETGEGE